jgi:ActR/RegA family two-component response regulator
MVSQRRNTPRSLALLLVEDDELIARAMIRQLIRSGYRPVRAASLFGVRAVLPTERWMGAIVDLNLGQDSGLDVAAVLREIDPALPIVFVTSETEPEILARAGRFGCVLPKGTASDVVLGALGLRRQR